MLAFLLDLVGHDGERAEQLLDKCLEEGVSRACTVVPIFGDQPIL